MRVVKSLIVILILIIGLAGISLVYAQLPPPQPAFGGSGATQDVPSDIIVPEGIPDVQTIARTTDPTKSFAPPPRISQPQKSGGGLMFWVIWILVIMFVLVVLFLIYYLIFKKKKIVEMPVQQMQQTIQPSQPQPQVQQPVEQPIQEPSAPAPTQPQPSPQPQPQPNSQPATIQSRYKLRF